MSTSTKPPAEEITSLPSPKPKKKPFSSPNEMVTFIVGTGDKQETFQIHKQVACEHSDVWNRAFNSMFIEGQTQTYRIEDTDPEVFRLLTQWVYRDNFDLFHSADSCLNRLDDLNVVVQCMQEGSVLLRLWVLAEKFLIHRLQNYTMRVLCNKAVVCEPYLNRYDYRYVYKNTTEGSALRRFGKEAFSDDWGQLSGWGESNYLILNYIRDRQFCEEWLQRGASLVD
ncbi:uncharacterized protein Bfra_000309ia [Botrytis fragariae]|uniref:BTB domain-containing protein n=1 Tax=Botrytis fragariae TaxID=1964551 RepID=A0A8H6B2D7_9HELO|nr:uncharacterized protein Bfra_000309ia [Botrytis fragariae]KAF5878141.1 hypothetical protein Bfra_000309ia [Botrytis fragariae]